MNTVIGVISHSSKRIGHTSRAAQRPVCVKQQRRQKLVAEDDYQQDHQHGLRNLGVGWARAVRRTIEENRADGKRNAAKRELLQNSGAQGSMFAGESEERLDLFFPLIQIVLHLAGQNLAELGVDAADICGEGVDQGHNHQKRNGDPLMGVVLSCGRHFRPDLPAQSAHEEDEASTRSCCSRRAISPASAS